MADVVVKFVRYDTEKTKKRKRSDLLVEAQTEYSIVKKLEEIHKNDSVIAIHEIVWGEIAPVEEEINYALETGVVKFFSVDKGFGFIAPDAEIDDLFFHVSALGGQTVYENDYVEFELSKGPKGIIAIRVKAIDRDSNNE